MAKKQVAIYVDEDVWNKFRDENKGKASQKIEEYMRLSLQHRGDFNFAAGEQIQAVSFNNPEIWSISYSSSTININNTTNSSSDDYIVWKIE